MAATDLTGKLGFKDFLAYVIPGFVSLLGLALLTVALSPSPMPFKLPVEPAATVALSAAVVALAYGIGIAFAEPMRKSEKDRVRRHWEEKALLGGAETFFKDSCLELFGVELSLAPDDIYETFYVCRALVREILPAAKSKMDRGGAIRQAAKNLSVPIVICGAGATVWALSLPTPALSYTLAIVFVVSTPLLQKGLMEGAVKARMREMREVFWSMAVIRATRKLQNAKALAGAG